MIRANVCWPTAKRFYGGNEGKVQNALPRTVPAWVQAGD